MKLAFIFNSVEQYLSSLTPRERSQHKELIFEVQNYLSAIEVAKRVNFSRRERESLVFSLTYSLLELHSYVSEEREDFSESVSIEISDNPIDAFDWDRAGHA